MAGNISYNELKYKVKGAIVDPPNQPKGHSFLSRTSTFSTTKLNQIHKKPVRRKSSSRIEEPLEQDSGLNTANLSFKAPQLIKFALDQIEQDTITAMIKNGKSKQLTAIEKGRLAVKFMSKKNKPLSNRHFYEHFYREHEKAERIQVLKSVSKNIEQILEGKGEDDLLKFIQQNYSIDDLDLTIQ